MEHIILFDLDGTLTDPKEGITKSVQHALRAYGIEEPDLEGFIRKLETHYPSTEYVNRLITHSRGQKVIRFYDPDGNLIEVGTPQSAENLT